MGFVCLWFSSLPLSLSQRVFLFGSPISLCLQMQMWWYPWYGIMQFIQVCCSSGKTSIVKYHSPNVEQRVNCVKAYFVVKSCQSISCGKTYIYCINVWIVGNGNTHAHEAVIKPICKQEDKVFWRTHKPLILWWEYLRSLPNVQNTLPNHKVLCGIRSIIMCYLWWMFINIRY